MRTSDRASIAVAVAALLVVAIAGSALGAGGKGGGSRGSLTLVVLPSETVAASTDSGTSVMPRYGDEITFEVSTTSTDEPFVNVRCYQGDAFVYDGWAGFFAWAWGGQTFTLTSPKWQGGEADCTARLVMWARNGRERTLASMDFGVLA